MRKDRKYRKNSKARGGYTLVELVVTFALVGIFMISATTVTASFTKMYIRISNTAHAQQAADVLLEKICGEIESAVKEDFTLKSYSGESQSLGFTNRNEIDVEIGLLTDIGQNETKSMADEKNWSSRMMVMQYTVPKTGADGSVKKEITDWYYGWETYMDNEVTALKFDFPESNLVKVTLTLTNRKTGYTFTTSRMVECYNLDTITLEDAATP